MPPGSPAPREPWSRRGALAHGRPAWIDFEDAYFFTVCSRPRGADQLANDRVATDLRNSLMFLERQGTWRLDAMVVMPDHVHWLAFVPPSTDLGYTVMQWKRYIARLHRVRWQRDFFERRLRARDRLDDKRDYLRQNPVRAGLARDASDWPYSWPAGAAGPP